MGTELVMRRVGLRLEPVSEDWAETLASIPLDKDLKVEVTAPRNLKQLRFVWALAKKVADARDDIVDKDAAMGVLCELSHHVDITVSAVTQHAHVTRRSLPHDSAEFSRLINRMVFVTVTKILPGVDEGALRAEIEAMCAGDQRAA